MAFGVNNKIRKILFFFNISNIAAYLKRKKIQKKYKKGVIVGLFSSINNSNLGEKVYVGTKVTVYNSSIGDYSYINSNTSIRDTVLGKFCSIGSNVTFGLGMHPMNLISTHPAFYSNNKGYKTFSKKNYFQEYFPIKVGNDVWVGYGAIIMGGVEIGDGAVIAAGSIVTKNVEPYSVVGGVPAKHIKYRFSKENIKRLQKSKWWDNDEKWFDENYLVFHDIEKFLKIIREKENIKNKI
jgi:acetyltransferase-like isoleucine patch superfamily enzyme